MSFEDPTMGSLNKDPMKPEDPQSSLTPEVSSGFRGGGGGGETGRIFEARVLGEYKITPEFLEAEKKLPRRRGRYEDDEDIYNLIIEHYGSGGGPKDPKDPTEPPTQIGRDIRLAVGEALGLSLEDEENLKFYTAVGTPIDYKMGVDAFIELVDPQSKRKTRVTIDVTLNERKVAEQYAKTDIVIAELPDAVQDEDRYLEELDRYGEQMAKILRNSTSRAA